jgi:hypothetical protein
MVELKRRSRRRACRAFALAFVALLTIAFGCRREATEPRRLVDTGALLSEEQRRSIVDYLAFIESERGVDYRVVVMEAAASDLVAEGVARYEAMQIGASADGQGMLLLVDVDSEEARVEVGYALEHRVRDVEASSMITDFLTPYFSSGQVASGIEASVERLVDVLDPTREEEAYETPVLGSGGAGATAALLAGIDRLTPETKARLQEIMVPQPDPGDCVRLEIALMHRGIYYRDVPMYDEAWRRAKRPDFPANRLKTIAREWDGPFEIESTDDRAITYYTGEKALRWGPQLLRHTDQGWIVDASSVARLIVYDYSNESWYALEEDNPYLPLLQSIYDMKRVSLSGRGAAWMIEAGSSGSPTAPRR